MLQKAHSTEASSVGGVTSRCWELSRQGIENRQAQFLLRAVESRSQFLRLKGFVEFGDLFLAFKEHVVEAIAVVFTIVGRVFPANPRTFLVHAAKIVRLQMVTNVVNHQKPRLAINEQRNFPVDHVPAEVVEIFTSHRHFDRQGKVLAALRGAVLAKNLTRLEISAGHFRFGHNNSLPRKDSYKRGGILSVNRFEGYEPQTVSRP